MTSPSKRRGDAAELEATAVLADELGLAVQRKSGASRLDDVGDLDGIPVQALAWADVLGAVRENPLEAEVQRGRAGATFAATMIRLRGGAWRVVMTPEQFSALLREALAPINEASK